MVVIEGEMEMQERIKAILTGMTVGDALGSTVDGLGKAHIRSTLGLINGYTDPMPALKGKMEHWRMPGLYTSISQLAFVTALSGNRKRFNPEAFLQALSSSPETSENNSGIFRNPDAAERNLIHSLMKSIDMIRFSMPSSRIIPSLVPLSFRIKESEEIMFDTIGLARKYTSDLSTIAGAMLYTSLMNLLLKEDHILPKDLIKRALDANEIVINTIRSSSHRIFESGINPDSLISSSTLFSRALEEVSGEMEPGEAEKRICHITNKTLKTPVKRATVNNPLSVLTYSLFLTRYYGDDSPTLLLMSAQEGGASSAMSSITGSITGCINGPDSIPETLVHELVNRKKILSLIDSVSAWEKPDPILSDFFISETSLTDKMMEELKSRLKHQKKSIKSKQKSSKDNQMEISQHIVESWTKLDKAKWKKERKKKKKAEE